MGVALTERPWGVVGEVRRYHNNIKTSRAPEPIKSESERHRSGKLNDSGPVNGKFSVSHVTFLSHALDVH